MIVRDMRRIASMATVMLIAWMALGHPAAARADGVSADATLILASDTGNGSDPQLGGFESRLRRLFRFKNYQLRGSGSANLSVPGKGTIGLPDNCRIALAVSDAGGGRLRVEVKWIRGGEMVVNTTVVNQRGDPIILGGPPFSGGTLIVSITLR